MTSIRSVGAVILAAGTSRRYGSPKQLVVIGGRTLLEHAIETALVAGLAPVVAVVPVWLSRPAGLDLEELRWVRNPFPERGMSLSLRVGLEALREDVSAVLILLGDQPRVAVASITAILAARGERPVVAASANGIVGPPALVERSHFHLIEGLVGDVGLRTVLSATPALVRTVPVEEHLPDLDTPEDLARLQRP